VKHDYTEFDSILLDLIRSGRVTAMALTIALENRAKQFEKTSSPFPCPPGRVVDKRLQALRKARKIKYGRNDWEVIE
jgi:hypothetical protein